MANRIDFNCDMGESFGVYKLGLDEEVIKYITSANVACGFHAGDPMWMQRTVRLAEEHGVAVGSQPSYPDLGGFGRRYVAMTPEEAKNDIIYQSGALQAFTRDKKLQHVKPHGALYNRAVNDESLAHAICEAVLEMDPELILLALAGSRWVEIAQNMGVRVAREIFADRGLTANGTLVPRSEPGAIVHDIDEVVDRSVRMVTEGRATAVTGEEIEMHAESLCLHGDTPGAVEMAKSLRKALTEAGVEIVQVAKLV